MVNFFKNIKRLKLKITSIIMLVVLLTLEFSPLAVKAVAQELQFYCPESIVVGWDTYNQKNVWYGKTTLGGKTAYCIDYTYHAPSGTMKLRKIASDQAIAILLNGYPNSSPESLGCQNADEAFMATQMALWEELNETDESKKTSYPFRVDNIQPVAGKEGLFQRATAGARKLLAIADANPYNYSPEFAVDSSAQTVKDIGDAVLVGPYKYSLTGVGDIAKLKSISATVPSPFKVTDANGNDKTTFNTTDEVYVKVSKDTPTTSFNLHLSVEIDRLYAYIYTSSDSNAQDYIMLDSEPKEAHKDYEINVKNDLTHGSLKLVKVDQEDKPVVGAKFRLEDENGKVVVKTTATDANGEINIKNVPEGNYVFIEEEAPNGYVIKDKSTNVTVKAGETAEVKVVNEKTNYKGTVAVLKVDDEEHPIEGVVFNVYDSNGNFVHEMTTKANGMTGLENLPLGKYYMEEVSAPEQYKVDHTRREFVLETDGQVIPIKVVNEKIKGALKITKVDDEDKPIGNVKFQILDENKQLVEELVTDESGVAVSSQLLPGTYYYKEIEAPKGYILDSTEHQFKIDNSGEMISEKVVNYAAKGKLTITKYDNTGKTLEGVKFEILDENDNVVDTIVTDKNGFAETKSLLLGTYYYREVEAPANVVMDTQKHQFSLTENNQIIPKTVINDVCEGKLKIIKLVEGKETPLAGVKFDILDADRNVIQTVETDENGEAMTDTLPYGKYYFKEVDAPDGYIMDATEHEFTIEKNGDLVEAIVYNAEETLPKTGGLLSDDMIIVIAISLISILGYGFIKLISDKKENC